MLSRQYRYIVGIVVSVLSWYSVSMSADQQNPPTYRIYSVLMDPREHPDYDRYYVQPPHWGIFDNRVHFSAMRGFGIKDNKIVNYQETLDRYTMNHDLGDVLWPNYSMLFADNLAEVLDEIKRRGLFLHDLFGSVPGSGSGGFWQQYHPPAESLELIEQKLGDHWLGMDNGEQDGRYIGGYSQQLIPANASRRQHYFNFQRHFERMTDELGSKMATLISLNNGHYFLKEGLYTLIGAETAQGLPNGQVYYAFIRGAGKQYGVPWFGNASVFNRWGYKNYTSEGEEGGYDYGPTKGTSLNLLKRLMYSHILYNCMLAGFESQFLKGDELTPIGRIQQAGWLARQKVKIFVDLTSGLNLYPDLRLINNLENDYQHSMTVVQEVMAKMKLLGCHDLILSLHRYPETNFTHEQTDAAFETTFHELATQADALDITLFVQPRPGTPAETHRAVSKLIGKIGSPRLLLAASTAILLDEKLDSKETNELLEGKIGLWPAAVPEVDIAGKLCSVNAPLTQTKEIDRMRSFLNIAPQCTVILDGYYTDNDQEYCDAMYLEQMMCTKKQENLK